MHSTKKIAIPKLKQFQNWQSIHNYLLPEKCIFCNDEVGQGLGSPKLGHTTLMYMLPQIPGFSPTGCWRPLTLVFKYEDNIWNQSH